MPKHRPLTRSLRRLIRAEAAGWFVLKRVLMFRAWGAPGLPPDLALVPIDAHTMLPAGVAREGQIGPTKWRIVVQHATLG
jgi:hypothetical protein